MWKQSKTITEHKSSSLENFRTPRVGITFLIWLSMIWPSLDYDKESQLLWRWSPVSGLPYVRNHVHLTASVLDFLGISSRWSLQSWDILGKLHIPTFCVCKYSELSDVFKVISALDKFKVNTQNFHLCPWLMPSTFYAATKRCPKRCVIMYNGAMADIHDSCKKAIIQNLLRNFFFLHCYND